MLKRKRSWFISTLFVRSDSNMTESSTEQRDTEMFIRHVGLCVVDTACALNDQPHHVQTCLCLWTRVRVRAPQRPHRRLKPLRAVYTNTPTEHTSCCQTAREIHLPDGLRHLGILRRKRATAETPNCCHIAALNPRPRRVTWRPLRLVGGRRVKL